MTILFFLMMLIGLFSNIYTSKFGLAYKVSKDDCSSYYLSNPSAYPIFNGIIFLITLLIGIAINFSLWIIISLYIVTFFLGRKWFWFALRNSYKRIFNEEPFRDDTGKAISIDEYIQTYKDAYKSKKNMERILRKL